MGNLHSYYLEVILSFIFQTVSAENNSYGGIAVKGILQEK